MMGANNSIQVAGVQYILDTVVQALAANRERKFVYGEMVRRAGEDAALSFASHHLWCFVPLYI
jgi:hypothetical protein